jgi:hypothetical protein
MPASYIPSEAADRRVARSHAIEIASGLGSKPVSYRRRCLGEPQFYYRVPFHADRFWCTVFVSDTAYKFTINPKRDTTIVDFCVALKQEWHSLRIVKPLPTVSAELGTAVFTSVHDEEWRVARRLLSPPVKTLLARIELPPVRRFYINDVQIDFLSELITSERCIQQVCLLRDLLLLVNREAYTNKNKLPT